MKKSKLILQGLANLEGDLSSTLYTLAKDVALLHQKLDAFVKKSGYRWKYVPAEKYENSTTIPSEEKLIVICEKIKGKK